MQQSANTSVLRTVEIRNNLWPAGTEVVPPDETNGAFWRDVVGRPYALPELLFGADEQSRAFLRIRHVVAIEGLLAASLRADQDGRRSHARTARHWARRLIGELDGWWVEQAREARGENRRRGK